MAQVERERLDKALLARGLTRSRAAAQAAIRDGRVRVNGRSAGRAADGVTPEDRIELLSDGPEWVGRGARKLIAAIDAFGLDPSGRLCLDIGASTGGFTEVLLARGAETVVAVDVGRGQLAPSLASDPRIIQKDGLNARDLSAADLPGAPGFVTADVSFISLTLALGPALSLAASGADGVFLVKPQFEAGRAAIGRTGVVTDPAVRAEAVDKVTAFVASAPGWSVAGTIPSPITGGDGNKETLLVARKDCG